MSKSQILYFIACKFVRNIKYCINFIIKQGFQNIEMINYCKLNTFQKSSNYDEINQQSFEDQNLLIESNSSSKNQSMTARSTSNQSKKFMQYITPVKDFTQHQQKGKVSQLKTKNKFIRPFQREDQQKQVSSKVNYQMVKLVNIINQKNDQIAYLQQTLQKLNLQIKRSAKKNQPISPQKKNIVSQVNQQILQNYFNADEISISNYKFIQTKKQVIFLKKNNQQLYEKLKQWENKVKQLQIILQRSLSLNGILQYKIEQYQIQIQKLRRSNQLLICQKQNYLVNQQKEIQFIKRIKTHWNIKNRQKSKESTYNNDKKNKQSFSTMSKSITNESTIMTRKKSKSRSQMKDQSLINQINQINKKLSIKSIENFVKSKTKV